MGGGNLFVQLLHADARGRADPMALTRALAVVLERDPSLVRHLVRCLGLRTDPHSFPCGGPMVEAPEARADGETLPLRLRCDDLLVYIDAPAGCAARGAASAVPAAARDARRRSLHAHLRAAAAAEGREGALIEVCTAVLPPPGDHLPLLRGLRFWWDISAAIEDWLAHTTHADADHRVYLAEQLLELMELMGLDPPAPLDPDRWLPEDADHLLVMAASGLRDVEAEVRRDGVLSLRSGGRSAELRWGPLGVEVDTPGDGRRLVPQPSRAFWEADLAGQLEFMVGLLDALVEDMWG